MNSKITWGTILLLSLLVTSCNAQGSENGSISNSNDLVTTLTPLGTNSGKTFDCDFLQQKQASQVFEMVSEGDPISTAIASIYDISELDVRHATYDIKGQIWKDQYRWVSVEPFYGQISHYLFARDSEVLQILGSSVNDDPLAFTLRDVINCLGIPQYISSYGYGEQPPGRYNFDAEIITLLYPDDELSVRLVKDSSLPRFEASTPYYLDAVSLYPKEGLITTIEEFDVLSWRNREPWPQH